MSKKKATSAHDFMAELQHDARWAAEQQAREKRWKELEDADRQEEIEVLEDLHRAGVEVSSVWDLVNSPEPYPRAIPVLLRHLAMPHPAGVREGIARALAVPEAEGGWTTLLAQFASQPDKGATGVKWALANALAVLVTHHNVNDVLPLIADPAHGENRAPLIEAVGGIDTPSVESTLTHLLDDVEVGHEATLAIGQLRSRRSSHK